ncbi:MAG: hypothetical protein AAF668_11490 [Pseudomonadota bacterium]
MSVATGIAFLFFASASVLLGFNASYRLFYAAKTYLQSDITTDANDRSRISLQQIVRMLNVLMFGNAAVYLFVALGAAIGLASAKIFMIVAPFISKLAGGDIPDSLIVDIVMIGAGGFAGGLGAGLSIYGAHMDKEIAATKAKEQDPA